MARGTYSFNIFEQYRLDLFLDQAWGRDEPGTATWQPLTGFGVAVNVRAPWNTILRADVGKSLLPAATGPRIDDAADSVAEAARDDRPTASRRPVTSTPAIRTRVSGNLPFLGSRDCYSSPADVYRVAKARGMDLVAITDHDSIDGALELLDRVPDARRHHRRRRSVVLAAGRRHRSASRRLRHDRGAAPRPAAAAAQRLRRRPRACAKPACSSR